MPLFQCIMSRLLSSLIRVRAAWRWWRWSLPDNARGWGLTCCGGRRAFSSTFAAGERPRHVIHSTYGQFRLFWGACVGSKHTLEAFACTFEPTVIYTPVLVSWCLCLPYLRFLVPTSSGPFDRNSCFPLTPAWVTMRHTCIMQAVSNPRP